MTGKTTQLVNEIKRKLTNKRTGEPEYKNIDQVIEDAVISYYNSLKRNKEL